MTDSVGVIGLGRMGSAIAQRMASLDMAVKGWTRSGRAVPDVPSAPDLQTLVNESDVIILSLLNNDAVSGILDRLATFELSGKLMIDTSTVSPELATRAEGPLHAKGASIVDAPISGGPELVMAGACGIFIGGKAGDVERAQHCLAALSERIFHVGPLGCGLVMKTINNGMLQIYVNGLIELMPLARRAGLKMETALNILAGGPAGMPMLADRLPRIFGEDSSVGFDVAAVFKDNFVFQDVANSYGVHSAALAGFGDKSAEAEADGILDMDIAALVRTAYEKQDAPE